MQCVAMWVKHFFYGPEDWIHPYLYSLSEMKSLAAQLLLIGMCGHHVKETNHKTMYKHKTGGRGTQQINDLIFGNVIVITSKDIAHVAIHGTSAPHDMLPGTEGESDNQNVPPSSSSTFIQKTKYMKEVQISWLSY